MANTGKRLKGLTYMTALGLSSGAVSTQEKIKKLAFGAFVTADSLLLNYDPFFAVFDWEQWARDNGVVIRLLPGGEHGTSTLFERTCITSFVVALQPKSIIEIGTFMGSTTEAFYLNTSDECQIYTFDLPDDFRSDEHTTDSKLIDSSRSMTAEKKRPYVPESPRVHQVLANSTTSDWRSLVPLADIDFFFIDGSHSYEHAKADTVNALQMRHPNTAIMWHDAAYRNVAYYTESYGVNQAIHDALPKEEVSKVVRLKDTSFALYAPSLFDGFEKYLSRPEKPGT
ncbi:MAG: class I SAM-dependent methyltransferase [Fimbriimonadaceae bacterium]